MRVSHYWAVVWTLAAAITGSVAPAAPAVGPRRPPNILFIFADDLGWNQLGCYGNTFYETPNVDRLATQGMRFTDAYAAGPVCSPTRASVMTGKYCARLHLTDYIPGNPYRFAKLRTPVWRAYLPLSEVTVAEVLKRAGYVTGHFGKWHLNKDKHYAPGGRATPVPRGSMRFSPRSSRPRRWRCRQVSIPITTPITSRPSRIGRSRS